MRSLQEIQTTIDAGLGKCDCDLKLEGVQLVNVFSSEIYETNIYIKNRRIVSIEKSANLKAKETIDCKNKYALPGFIDTHMHFETTMLSPEALTEVILPKGTTTLCADLMEIANVCGEEGIDCMLESIKELPYRMLIEVPSRVPTAPNLETTGAILDSKGVDSVLSREESISLGEIDPSKILFFQGEYLEKIYNALKSRKIVNGHAIGRTGQELNVYASAGISDDHECVTKEEMLERLRLGMKVLVREGSTERNLDELISGALEANCDFENLCFCTDDKHVNEINTEGHINYNVNRAIELGMKPMDAIKVATINAAKHFRLEDELGSITPGRLADIILCDSIENIQPEQVIFEGKVVYAHERVTAEVPQRVYPDWIKNTITFKKPITPASFEIKSNRRGTSKVNVIDLIDKQIINTLITEELEVKDGLIYPGGEVAKIAVVERYNKNGNVGLGFVKGFTLTKGAVAFSTSHDHHNIVCIGANDEDMALCANEIKRIHGGLSVALNGEILNSMSLQIGGLMSDKNATEVNDELMAMNESAKLTGCSLEAPFMALSFISLPTVPEVGITDLGLVDVLKHSLMDLEV